MSIWSPVLELREGHSLVTSGIYQHVRHPMYASQWLWMIAQSLLLQNWLAGLGGALLFLPMYFIRIPQEEQMMIDRFGDLQLFTRPILSSTQRLRSGRRTS